MSRSEAERLAQQMRQTVEEYDMLLGVEKLLVAVSGGVDSMVLLHALVQASARFAVEVRAAHFNHGLRGPESDGDQALVEAYGARLGVPLDVGGPDEPIASPSLEAKARDQRYSFLHAVSRRTGCGRIATAHTLDDQAETVLMRLLRGSGADGLQGIRPVRSAVIRPLLDVPRAGVLAYAERHDVPFRIDTSNSDRRHLRNRVRHDVLPLLASINPQVARALAATATNVQDEAAALAPLASEARTRCGVGAALSVRALRGLAPGLRRRVIREWLDARGVVPVGRAHLLAVCRIVVQSAGRSALDLPGGHIVVRHHDELQVRSGAANAPAI